MGPVGLESSLSKAMTRGFLAATAIAAGGVR